MLNNKTISNVIEESLNKDIDNVKKLTIGVLNNDSILTLLECYKLFNESSIENSKENSKIISNKLKTIDFNKTIDSLSDILSLNFNDRNQIDNVFESLSNNKFYMDEYDLIKKEISDLSKVEELIKENIETNDFLSIFDGSLNNNVLVDIAKNSIKSKYGDLSENYEKLINTILLEDDQAIKDLHNNNIKLALSKIDESIKNDPSNLDNYQVKNKLLSFQVKLLESNLNDNEVIKIINLLDSF